MKKRILAAIFALVLLMTAIPAVLAEDNSPGAGEGYYYVYTENGRVLNVRDEPNGNVVGSLKYGSRIYVYFIQGNWALITYHYNKPGYGAGDYACYVNRRFLTTRKPAARTAGSAKAAESAVTGADNLSGLNAEFRSAKNVTPYPVTVRPSRVSGWGSMRWAPSLEAEIMAVYKANDQLLVIRETDNWYQVQDQNTGNVGFIGKSFVTE